MFGGDLSTICLDALPLLGFLQRLRLIVVLVLLSGLFLLLALRFLRVRIRCAEWNAGPYGNQNKTRSGRSQKHTSTKNRLIPIIGCRFLAGNHPDIQAKGQRSKNRLNRIQLNV